MTTQLYQIGDERLDARFWENVQPEYNSGCWLWTGCTSHKGYGRIQRKGKTYPVYRLCYTSLVGRVPRELQMDHLCRNPSCCNPAHLEPVTPRINVLRGLSGLRTSTPLANRLTHCPHGHERTPENTYICPRGKPNCRQCKRDSARLWWRENVSKNFASKEVQHHG